MTTLAGPARRGMTLSILLVAFNLICYSLGSAVVGKLSGLLAPAYGPQSLRYAFACGFVFCALAFCTSPSRCAN